MSEKLQHQIAITHAELIRLAVAVRQDRDLAPALFELLQAMEEAGWGALVKAIIGFVQGEDIDLAPLDEEDRAIVQAMQRGLDDPHTLAALEEDAAQQAAAPLAALLYAATQGERAALEAVAGLRELADTPASRASCEALIAIVEGARDAEALTSGLPAEQARLVCAVLGELDALEAGQD